MKIFLLICLIVALLVFRCVFDESLFSQRDK